MTQQLIGQFDQIASGVYLEGLAIDHQRNVIWYSDVIAGGIHCVTPTGSKLHSLNTERMWTGGVMMNEDGAVLSTGQGGILWNNPVTGASGWLLDRLEGKPINGINEMIPDGTGGIYFGTNDIERVIEAKPTRPTAIYRLTVNREVIKVADGINFSNGLAYDTSRKHFYCSDTFARVWRWDVQDDLSLTNQRALLEKEDCDGMALDAEGNVWITGFRSSGYLMRVKPDGTVLPKVETPPGSITQVRFGGADMRDYYFNVVPADGGDSLKDGKPLSGGSNLYRGRSEVPGRPIPPARFNLG